MEVKAPTSSSNHELIIEWNRENRMLPFHLPECKHSENEATVINNILRFYMKKIQPLRFYARTQQVNSIKYPNAS